MLVSTVVLCWLLGGATAVPRVVDTRTNVTYQGQSRNGIDVFLGIKYAHDTSGQNRFKPPVRYNPPPGSFVDATSYGMACSQKPNASYPPLILDQILQSSEDCLNLNIARPANAVAGAGLPVMAFIHGGSFWIGSNAETSYAPDGLVIQSIRNQLPVIHVAANYRLGAFGFAQSTALKDEGSENAGLRDQRSALEWIQENIEQFGGDPKRVTIFGQSSGGLAMGMQTLAYGGSRPVPFQQAICESQALEPGITGNFTRIQMDRLVQATGCNTTALDSPATIACLRNLSTDRFLQASVDTYSDDPSANIGDCWLPVVDGDFLPDAPSTLLRENKFANITTMIGWCQDDVTPFTPLAITTANDTYGFFAGYLPGFTNSSLTSLLALYPSSEFQANPSANLSAEFYRTARIFRDILMTCQPIYYGSQLARVHNPIFYYDQNQTIEEPIEAAIGTPGLGVFHTSEFAYVFGNLSHYNRLNYPFNPTPDDYRLEMQQSRSWSSFAATGQPWLFAKNTLYGWTEAYPSINRYLSDLSSSSVTPDNPLIYVIGGPQQGLSSYGSSSSNNDNYEDCEVLTEALASQKLAERCAFINSPDIIAQLNY